MDHFSQLLHGAVDLGVLLLSHDLIKLSLDLGNELPYGLVSLEGATIARWDCFGIREVIFVVHGGLGLIFTQGRHLLITDCTVFERSGPW